ncbi:hypothetical protein O1611_g7726 [Lasiodiplodia mahajangana]|uniref:Uncharacterized protein n=1 Tax=Lasiodiplodia mahajangana TaxID=1108764 RepID=A0ACC2JEQ4_9PEZI|nr:hypothetical protein O1611_g7726 [Lasiodiplodia mahajangana]
MAGGTVGLLAVVNQLQGAGVEPDRKDEYSYRALVRLAYQEDWAKLSELLMVRGGSPTTLDYFSLSLTRAAAGGHKQIVAHLISVVPPGFYDDGLGANALVAASRYGHFEIVRMIVHLVPMAFQDIFLQRSRVVTFTATDFDGSDKYPMGRSVTSTFCFLACRIAWLSYRTCPTRGRASCTAY